MVDYVDFYKQVLDGLIDRLRLSLKIDFLVDHLDEKVSTSESNLQRGADYYIVIKPGGHSALDGRSIQSKSIQTMDWGYRLEMYVRFIERKEEWSRFTAFRSAVEYHLIMNRYLDATVIEGESLAVVPNVENISITPAGEAGYYRITPEAVMPNFMTQPLNVTVRQRVRYG